jgi:FSR family fosmidomycin resistance protein-like MFS transporter
MLSILISSITASAFSAILIYAMDLVPHRNGVVGTVFYGLAFSLAGIAAAALGTLDHIGIEVFRFWAWLPALGP